jgi:hypothetical protein
VAKIDKTQYSKEEWRKIKEERRQSKLKIRSQKESEKVEPILGNPNASRHVVPLDRNLSTSTAFVLGNGISRKPIDPAELKPHGKIYGCNAIYREFSPDYLVAVDVKMILEINKHGYQHKHEVWTNPNKAYHKMTDLNLFHPSKGWSSGPTALWLASQHRYDKIFILGFDYKGLENGKRVNNIYADTMNYKKSTEAATFFGNWMRQTTNVIKENPNTTFYRVIASDNYVPEELNKFNNVKHIFVEDFKKMFNIS